MQKSDMLKYGTAFMHAVIVVCLVILLVYVVKLHKFFTEEGFANLTNFAQSYSSGATQRFQQENTDPTLGGQFGPYNMDIRADKTMLGSENLTSAVEQPVIYNEPGLHNMHDSAESGGISGNNMDDLLDELYN